MQLLLRPAKVKIGGVKRNNHIHSQLKSKTLWAFIALFLILGLGYSTLTPIFENSDETLHYPYVKHLADGQGLPLATPGQLWNQEGTQPPLYYAIVAATTFWINTDNLLEHLQPNPHWRFSEVRPLINDNQNVVLHGPMDAFPYRQTALAIHIGRWWSLFFGLVTVICTFLITQHFFPNNHPLIISATALTALTPQFIRVSATVSNDSLSAALASFTVLLALKFTAPLPTSPSPGEVGRGANAAKIQPQSLKLTPMLTRAPAPVSPPRDRHAIILGLLAGLALLTKFSSLTVFFLAILITFWRNLFLTEIHQRPWQKMLRWVLIICGITLAMTGWWFWRNYQLYGEWLATETHLNLAGRGNLSLFDVWHLRSEAERAYWATFGWGQIRPPEWFFRLLGWFTRLGLISLGLAVLVKLVQGSRSKPIPLNLKSINFEIIIFLATWAGLNLLLYLRWVMEVGSVSHTRLIYPAITAISLLLALGWHALFPQRIQIWFSGLLTAGLLILNVYSLGWLINPAFTPPETPSVTLSLNLTFLDTLHLTGGDVQVGPPNLFQMNTATQGDTVTIRARWHTIAPMNKNYSVAAVLLAPDGSVLARRETYPGLGLRPTRYLNPGDTFVDTYPLEMITDVPEPIVARAVVNLFDFDSETRAGFPALNADGQEVTPIVGQIKIVPQTRNEYEPTHTTSVNFANAITLIGYDFTPQSKITLYWKSLAPADEDYNLFIHLLDTEGNVIAQADAPPTNNAYPTSWWSPGETIADIHLLPEATNAARIRLGFYSLASTQRLPITESTLPGRDNSVEIELPSLGP